MIKHAATKLPSLRPAPTLRATLALATLALASICVTGCGGGRTEAVEKPAAGTSASGVETSPVTVETAIARSAAIPVSTRATGSVEPLRQVSPGTKILGRVDAVAVREGDFVRRGALLARLESRDLEAAVTQGSAAVQMAEAQLENARAQRDRIQELHGRGSATEKSLEDVISAHRMAEAGLEQAKAGLAAAEVMLSYAEITSPLDGWIVAKGIETGDMASPGRSLFTIEDLSRVKINVQVPETDVVGRAEGDPATVSLLGAEVAATINRIVPAGDPASRTFSVRLVLENPEGRFKSGMFARVRFDRGERQALRLPATALVERGQLEGIFLAANGFARLRFIKTGRADGGSVEILSGLEEGEEYVVDPPPGLVDGARITAHQ